MVAFATKHDANGSRITAAATGSTAWVTGADGAWYELPGSGEASRNETASASPNDS